MENQDTGSVNKSGKYPRGSRDTGAPAGKKGTGSRRPNPFPENLSDIQFVGRYEIVKKLGRGSMGVVYLGRDPYIKRDVGVKIFHTPLVGGGDETDRYRQSFFLEAQSAGKLMHPNIVTIYDAGMYKDFCYLTMEYVNGSTLKRFCRKEHLLPVRRVVEIVFTVCRALGYAHKQDLVHRDVKPANIMINREGKVKITDFGIAKLKTQESTSEGIIGSPFYMSPEQIREERVDNKSDIFSLGCVLYELLTGEKAFPGKGNFAVMQRIVRDEPVPLKEKRPEISDTLETIVTKALSKDPDKRYQTCRDFAYDLMVAMRGLRERVKSARVEDKIDYLRSATFFEPFSRNQLKEILGASEIVHVRKGEVIVSEGQIDDYLFVILSGNAAVKRNNSEIVTLDNGECFGEMAPLSGGIRTATVRALTDCVLVRISATLLERLSESIQLLFYKNFTMTLIQRLSKSMEFGISS